MYLLKYLDSQSENVCMQGSNTKSCQVNINILILQTKSTLNYFII